MKDDRRGKKKKKKNLSLGAHLGVLQSVKFVEPHIAYLHIFNILQKKCIEFQPITLNCIVGLRSSIV